MRIDTDPEGEGTPLLFETYQLASSIADRRRELTSTFLPVLVVTLVALVLLMVPLAWVLARRVRARQRDRERLLQRALDASDRERRRIAGDLHDGPVQELAGLAMRLSAEAERVGDADAGERAPVLGRRRCAAACGCCARRSWASIRRTCSRRGCRPRSRTSWPRLDRQGIEVSLEVEPDADFGAEVDELLYRAARRRCATSRSTRTPHHVRVAFTPATAAAVLEVVDDGRGIAPDALAQAAPRGHMGLRDPRRPGERRRRHADGRTRSRSGYGRARGGAGAVITRGARRRPPGRAGRAGAAARDLRRRRVRGRRRRRRGGRRDLCGRTSPTSCCSTCRCPTSTAIEVTRRSVRSRRTRASWCSPRSPTATASCERWTPARSATC